MSTKIYHGFRSHERAIATSVAWLRRAMWRGIVATLGPSIATFEDAGRVAREYSEAGIHVWHDAREGIALYSIFGPSFCTWVPKPPAFLREYGYWDNADAPAGMSRRRWQERAETWTRVVFDSDRWDERMTIVVLAGDSFGQCNLALECVPKYRKAWPGGHVLLSRQPLPASLPRRARKDGGV